MNHNIYLYILTAAAVSFAIRVIPLTLIRKKIKNPFVQSFLFYVPYVTLAVMTFPAIIDAAQSPIAGIIALIAGIIASYIGASVFQVALLCCGIVFLIENILIPLLPRIIF